jgi:hypothetical protein
LSRCDRARKTDIKADYLRDLAIQCSIVHYVNWLLFLAKQGCYSDKAENHLTLKE